MYSEALSDALGATSIQALPAQKNSAFWVIFKTYVQNKNLFRTMLKTKKRLFRQPPSLAKNT